MRWTPLSTCVALFLLGGCLEAGEEPPEIQYAGEERASRSSRVADGEYGAGRYEGTSTLTVNPDGVVVVGVGGVTSGDCVLFWDTGGADYVMRNGTVTMEWDAMTPLAEELAIYVTGFGSGPDASVRGRSPLVLAIEEIEASDWGIGFAADAPMGSLAVQQPVQLAMAFDWEGDLPAPGIGSCSNGIP